ncbi:MAG: dihydrolipoyl dehydrogenase [Clostridia bacterium]
MKYDLIILGGGPAGYTGAIKAAKEGLSVLLIERERLGGVCLNKGCIPTKTLLKCADIYYSSVNSEKFGVNFSEVSYDINAFFVRKNDIVNKLVDGVSKLVAAAGVTVIFGDARLTGSQTVAVGSDVFQANHIMLATGGSAVLPPIKGIQYALNSDDVLNGIVNGEKVVIVGGGVIGVEFATFFKKIGKQVTIIELADRILPLLDRDISLNLTMCLKKLGIEIFVGAGVSEICDKSVKFSVREREQEIPYDSIIVCTGRRANTLGLGLENTKVKFDKTGVFTNEFRHTDDEFIYAVGDLVSGNIQLAHNASADAEVVVHNILNGDTKVKPKFVPSCIYTSPEAAIVGLNEAEAVAQGIEVEFGKFPMAANGKAVLDGEDKGFIKVLFNKTTQKLLGVSLLSERATDIIGAITTLVELGVSRDEILNSIYPHPTIVEAFYEATLDSVGKAVHILSRKK